MATLLLEKSFTEIAKLSDGEQDAWAQWILDEIASEQHWQVAFESSQNLLAQLADEALAEHRAGQTQVMDIDRL